MNKPVSLGPSILYLSNLVMYEFWYDYLKPKYGGKSKLEGVDQKDSLTIWSGKNMIEGHQCNESYNVPGITEDTVFTEQTQ